MIMSRTTEIGILTDRRPFANGDGGHVVAIGPIPKTGIGTHDQVTRQPDSGFWIDT